jgi:hypothetical protein
MVMVHYPPMTLLCQQFVLFETALFESENPFPTLPDVELYGRQCPASVILHIPALGRLDFTWPHPVFPGDQCPPDKETPFDEKSGRGGVPFQI